MGRHDHLIETLFKEEADRKLARDFAAKFDGEPQMSDRIEPLLREAARTAQRADGGELTPEQAREYLGSFAKEGLGLQDHIITGALGWLNAGGRSDDQVVEDRVAEMSPEVRQLIAADDRKKALEDVAKYEAMIRDPEGSRKYWADPKLQEQYRNALERSIAVPEAPAPAAADEVRAALLGTAPPAVAPIIAPAPTPAAPAAPPGPAAEPART